MKQNSLILFFQIIMIILLLLVLGTINSCGVNQVTAADGPEPFSFCVIGDRTGTHESGVFRKVVDAALDEDPDFLIDVGDMIEGGTENWCILTRQWLEYTQLIEHVTIPFYHTAGNHDLFFTGQLVQYIQYAGLPYYAKDYKNIKIIVLNNSRWVYPDTAFEQMKFLKHNLENNDQDFTFIFFHKPFWDMYLTDSTLNHPVHDLFLEHNVTAVFAGHYHNHFSTEYNGIKYTIVGRSGGGSTYNHPDFTSHDPRYIRSDFEYHSFEKVTVSDKVIIEHFDVKDLYK